MGYHAVLVEDALIRPERDVNMGFDGVYRYIGHLLVSSTLETKEKGQSFPRKAVMFISSMVWPAAL